MSEDYSKRSFEFEGVRYQMVKTEKGSHMCDVCEASGKVCEAPTNRPSCSGLLTRDGWHYVKVSNPSEVQAANRTPDPKTKYLRDIYPVDGMAHTDANGKPFVRIDVYSVLRAFSVDHPTGHAIKKLLCAGMRGKGDRVQDLTEAKVAIDRAIQEAGI
jgi:hypothetical protein